MQDLTDVFSNWEKIWNDSRPECQQARNGLNEIFHMEIQTGSLTVPEQMNPIVEGWLGHNADLVSML